ncbi:MAG: DUF1987 domain-containing protein [Bacteroidales bacterium]|nr:DUF1987 domain-containing protein [Bacteroidales bacterium]
MDALIVAAREDSPGIRLDKQNSIFEISGNSYADDPVPYYIPIFDWLDEYKKDPNESTLFEFKLNYINTASSKQIANILTKLEETRAKSKVKIKWFYHKDDEDMYDEGLALKNNVKIEFEFIETD